MPVVAYADMQAAATAALDAATAALDAARTDMQINAQVDTALLAARTATDAASVTIAAMTEV